MGPLKDYRSEHRHRTLKITRYSFRSLFGLEAYEQRGHFVENEIGRLVDDYACWIEYQKKDDILRYHRIEVTALTVSDDGRVLFSGSADWSIAAWDMIDHHRIHQVRKAQFGISALVYHRSGRLISSGKDGSIQVRNAFDDLDLMMILKGHTKGVWSIDITTKIIKGDRLISGSADGDLKVWDLDNGDCLNTLKSDILVHSTSNEVRSVNIFNETVISGAMGGSLKMWNLEDSMTDGNSDESVKILDDLIDGASVFTVRFNCDGSMIGCVCSKFIRFFDSHSLELIQEFQFSGYAAEFHPFNPDIFATEDVDSFELVMCHIRSGKQNRLNRSTREESISLCWTPDGSRVITGGMDRTVRITDVTLCSFD